MVISLICFCFQACSLGFLLEQYKLFSTPIVLLSIAVLNVILFHKSREAAIALRAYYKTIRSVLTIEFEIFFSFLILLLATTITTLRHILP